MPSAKEKKEKKLKEKKQEEKFDYKKSFIHYAYCLAIIFLLTLTSININKFLNTKKVLGASVNVTPLQNEKSYWQNLVDENPTYVDGYLQLAKVDVELGNVNEATTFINKALSLDPNSSKIPEVQHELGL